MNPFDATFAQAHASLAAIAGETVAYTAGAVVIAALPVVFGSKRVEALGSDGAVVVIKQQYAAVDGALLVDSGGAQIKPAKGHYLVCRGVRFNVVQQNGVCFESAVPSVDEAGLLRIFLNQQTGSAQ